MSENNKNGVHISFTLWGVLFVGIVAFLAGYRTGKDDGYIQGVRHNTERVEDTIRQAQEQIDKSNRYIKEIEEWKARRERD